MSINIFTTPKEVALNLAKRAKNNRLSLNISQKTLAERSGVSLGSLKKFEQSGKISLESLLKIALTLDSLEEFNLPFKNTIIENPRSLEDLFKNDTRHRGRK